MARADGRVKPGQNISTAFSARAWNRAQDAADVVLSGRVGFEAAAALKMPDRLYRTVRLEGFSETNHRFGMVVRGGDIPALVSPLPFRDPQLGATPPITTGYTYAQLASPVAFVDRRLTATLSFAVLCGGRGESMTGTGSLICTHGTCLAMVRKNPGGFLPRVRLPVLRYESDTSINLLGVAEDSDCGPGELLLWTNIKPFSEEQQTAEGIETPVELDDTLEQVYYAVVRL